MIECRDVSHSYSLKKVLDHLSFRLESGKIYGVLGPNGSGKTTLFHILTTMIHPSSGAVFLNELEVKSKNLRRIRQELGVVFQSSSLDKKLTVRENLGFQGVLYGMHGHALQERISEALRRFHLDEYQDTLVETLSGGWARRAEIAKSTLHSPKMLFLDEPSGSLDPAIRLELWKIFRKLQSEGCTIVLTTHLLDEAELCDELILMHQGRIVVQGTPYKIKTSIGKNIIQVRAKNPDLFAKLLGEKKNLKMLRQSQMIRIEVPDDIDFVPELVNHYKNEIEELTYRAPNLEDAFLHFTGAEFSERSA